jgi:hypothetical protein
MLRLIVRTLGVPGPLPRLAHTQHSRPLPNSTCNSAACFLTRPSRLALAARALSPHLSYRHALPSAGVGIRLLWLRRLFARTFAVVQPCSQLELEFGWSWNSAPHRAFHPPAKLSSPSNLIRLIVT